MKLSWILLPGLVAIVTCNVCPDGSSCPGLMTCCELFNGWGCCLYSKAVCCSDKRHCCPRDTICDVVNQQCIGAVGESTPWTKEFLAVQHSDANAQEIKTRQMCPDGKQKCPDDYTCCQMPLSDYGCCPLQNAVCCPDRIHCCPSGSVCDVDSGSCVKGSSSKMANFIEKLKLGGDGMRNGGNTVCPDHRSQCPIDSTCCMMKNGQYGCCPLPHATCCSNKETCCPHNTRCAPGGRCVRKRNTVPYPFSTVLHKSNNIPV